jgi:hypothetical protein
MEKPVKKEKIKQVCENCLNRVIIEGFELFRCSEWNVLIDSSLISQKVCEGTKLKWVLKNETHKD